MLVTLAAATASIESEITADQKFEGGSFPTRVIKR